MLLRALVLDNYAYVALGFLAVIVLIQIGLGSWVVSHLSKKKATN